MSVPTRGSPSTCERFDMKLQRETLDRQSDVTGAGGEAKSGGTLIS